VKSRMGGGRLAHPPPLGTNFCSTLETKEDSFQYAYRQEQQD